MRCSPRIRTVKPGNEGNSSLGAEKIHTPQNQDSVKPGNEVNSSFTAEKIDAEQNQDSAKPGNSSLNAEKIQAQNQDSVKPSTQRRSKPRIRTLSNRAMRATPV